MWADEPKPRPPESRHGTCTWTSRWVPRGLCWMHRGTEGAGRRQGPQQRVSQRLHPIQTGFSRLTLPKRKGGFWNPEKGPTPFSASPLSPLSPTIGVRAVNMVAVRRVGREVKIQGFFCSVRDKSFVAYATKYSRSVRSKEGAADSGRRLRCTFSCMTAHASRRGSKAPQR